jgi:release factor glutamine methyltransferase
MRRYFKFIAGIFLIPITRWYLRKERRFEYEGIKIRVFTTVFHPGFFGSTRFILAYLKNKDLRHSTFLEVGSGTGLLSVYAAQHGAAVTAVDLNPVAVENTRTNCALNHVNVHVLLSDLFKTIPKQTFDWIVINPPYYPKTPRNSEELAWYCGEGFEYFKKLFIQLGSYTHTKTTTIMALSQACDIETIRSIGGQSGFSFELVKEDNAFFDAKNFLFRINGK